MASHVSDTWHAMCVTHGMPCVNMRGSLPCLYKGLTWAIGRGRESSRSVHGSSKEKRKGGKEKEEEGKEKGRKGKEEGRKGKEKGKKKREEERGGREEKERGRGRSVPQWAAPDGKESGTALQEVGFLLHWLFYA